MNTDLSTQPGVNFIPASGLFPNIVNNEIAAEQRALDNLNASGLSAFNYSCTQWLSSATLARNANEPLPTKPQSPVSWVLLTQQGVQNGQPGTFILQSQTGPVYGVCPDLPPLAGTPSGVSGIVPTGTPTQPTQDQKIDSIAATVLNTDANVALIVAALKNQGVM